MLKFWSGVFGLCLAGLFLGTRASPERIRRAPEDRYFQSQSNPSTSITRDPSNAYQISYNWIDHNTQKILYFQGDTYRNDPSVIPVSMNCQVSIDPNGLEYAINSYGIPESWMSFRYTSPLDFRNKVNNLRRQANARGIELEVRTNPVYLNWRIAYDWVINQSRFSLRNVALGLMNGARATSDRYRTYVDFAGLVASFVQHMPYRIPADYRPSNSGGRIFTGGITMPLETLYNGWGDCDTKTLLFTSLFANIQNSRVVFLEGNNHIFAGIWVPGLPLSYHYYIELQGLKYVLVELTYPWHLGHIPQENLQRLGTFRVYPVL